MAEWHLDERCNDALVKLDDALCTFERATSREYTLILVPKSPDEEIYMSQSGKPLSKDLGMSSMEILGMALSRRERQKVS